ncbi:leucine-rich repeat domain-containing protein [Ralstonia pseudosolanacearum]|uniref:Disease resistance R13L4/SHOC-2-like LRR domain-containing protein n=1 Tax=Ralstonia solanacearum TaxID=305 RepID=A0AA92EH86_RALSL|nr:hypothetical protein [Ralstonia pseudosolanacearum]QCX50950.1 hypothetical protein E7Z57_17605 [Ralstonia pseudosolanacearum]
MREAPARQPRSRGVFDRILHPRRSRASAQAAETPFASPIHPRISATPPGAVPGSPLNARHGRAPARSAPTSPFRMPGGQTPGRSPRPAAGPSLAATPHQIEHELNTWQYQMESALGSFSQVSRLNYAHTPTQALSEAVARLRQATTLGSNDTSHSLSFRNAPIRYLPDAVTQLTHLQRIFLEDCDLRTLPAQLGNLNQLQELSLLYHPNLRYLPDSLNNLSALRTLELRETGITELPQINRLSQLKTLSIEDTRLAAIPSEISALRNLKSMTVARTNIREVPSTIGNLMHLKKLTLSRNPHLQAVPASIGNLSSLQELSLNGCRQLQALPDTIGNLRHLDKLYLHDCSQLQTLPESIANLMPHLRRLDLKGCTNLQRLPDCLLNPPRHLHLTLPTHLRQAGSSRGTPASQGNTPTASPPRGASPMRLHQPVANPAANLPAGLPHRASAPSAQELRARLAPLERQGGNAERVAQWLNNRITNAYQPSEAYRPPALNERVKELVDAVTAGGPGAAALHRAIAEQLRSNPHSSLDQIERAHLEHRRQTEPLNWADFIALATQQVRRNSPFNPASALQGWPALREYARTQDPLVKLLMADFKRLEDELTDGMFQSQADLRASSERTRVLADHLKHVNDNRLPAEYARIANEWVNGRPSSSAMQEALHNLMDALPRGEYKRLETAATALPTKLQDALSPLMSHKPGRELVQAIGEQAASVEVPKNLSSQLDGLATQIDHGIQQITKMMRADKKSTAEQKATGFAMALPRMVEPLWEGTLKKAQALDVADNAAAEEARRMREAAQRERANRNLANFG